MKLDHKLKVLTSTERIRGQGVGKIFGLKKKEVR
jgi:hypothetical protein